MALDAGALQNAIYDRVTAQITDIPLYTNVPQKTPYPYFRIDSIAAQEDGAKDASIYEYEVMISAFYLDTVFTHIDAGLKRLAAALHEQQAALTMTGYVAILCRMEMQDRFQQSDDDGRYLHGVQRYRILVQEL